MRLLSALLVPLLLALAGCLTPPAETLTAASDASMAEASGESVRVEKGKLAPIVVACGPTGCVAPPAGPAETRMFPLEGNATSVANLTLTWTASSPHASKLRLQVRNDETAEVLAFAEGTSPLVLEYALADAEGEPLHVAVSFTSTSVGPATAQVRHDQAFELAIGLRG